MSYIRGKTYIWSDGKNVHVWGKLDQSMKDSVWAENKYNRKNGAVIMAQKHFDKILKEHSQADLKKRIGMLRQWLNEDRITDRKMVTNKELEEWLLPERKK